jgi:hypothetical protein
MARKQSPALTDAESQVVRQLVPQAQQEGEIRRGPPGVVDERVKHVPHEFRVGDGGRVGGHEHPAKQE